MEIRDVTAADFDDMRNCNTLRPGAYRIGDAFAFSPDGEGVYWYDTEAELIAEVA